MVFQGTDWSFQALTGVPFLCQAEAPKKVLESTFYSQSASAHKLITVVSIMYWTWSCWSKNEEMDKFMSILLPLAVTVYEFVNFV